MTPHEAEEFQKTGKAEAEAQFAKILARSKGSRQQLAEAREVAADLSRQLQEAGTTQEVADLQVKPLEMMHCQCSSYARHQSEGHGKADEFAYRAKRRREVEY